MGRRWVFALVAVLIASIIIVWVSFPFILSFMVDLGRTRRMQDLRVAYYNGEGAWSTDNIVIPNLVAWMGCSFSTIRGSDIQAGDLVNFDVLIWPGGHYPAYWEEVGQVGKVKIQKFVANGGGYLGICAGAYWACDYMVWMDDDAFPPPDFKVEGDEENLD
ncbi:MAG: BPL-N domain-containing protein, partial [Promethearchaeota archaeon]